MKVYKKIYIILLYLLFLTTQAFSQVNIELDKQVGTLYDAFVLELSCSASECSNPEPPKIDSFEIQQAGTSHSTRIINGRRSSSVTWKFILRPKEVGSFTIPSFKVSVDGNIKTTETITIQVKKAENNSQLSDKPLFYFEREITSSTPYLGERVLIKGKIFYRASRPELQLERPKGDFFELEQVGEQKNYIRNIDGTSYQVIEFWERLTPLKAGAFELSPHAVVARYKSGGKGQDPFGFGGFFDDRPVKQQMVYTNSSSFNIKELPDENKPDNFSGLVGRKWSFLGTLGSSQIKAGETVTLTLTLEGMGNLEGNIDFNYDFPLTSKVYPDKPGAPFIADDGKSFRREFKLAIVPTEKGILNFDSIHLWVFDTESKEYKKLSANNLSSVTVLPGEEKMVAAGESFSTGRGVEKENVKKLGEDIFALHRTTNFWENKRFTWIDAIIIWNLGLIPWMIGLFLYIKNKVNKKDEEDIKRRKSSKAFKVFKVKTKEYFHTEFSYRLLERFAKSFREFLSSKWQLDSSGAVTSREAYQLMKSKGYEKELSFSIYELLKSIERYEYTSENLSCQDFHDLMNNALGYAKEVDKND